jgi:6,7-dimethyl-8-ribityllumazine synthase
VRENQGGAYRASGRDPFKEKTGRGAVDGGAARWQHLLFIMSNEPLESSGENADGLRFAIVASRYNKAYVEGLLQSAFATLRQSGVAEGDIEVTRVPGALEIPYAASMLAATGDFDCVIALGVVIEGDTSHHDVIARSTADAFHIIARKSEVPVVNGVIDVHNAKQAEERCNGRMNRGAEFAKTALEMAVLKVQLTRRLDEIYDEEQAQREKEKWHEFFDEGDQDWKS